MALDPQMGTMRIKLNGEPFEVTGPLTVGELLARLGVDARRVAVERNLVILKRGTFDRTAIEEGDEIEIVNFVGGGAGTGSGRTPHRLATGARVVGSC